MYGNNARKHPNCLIDSIKQVVFGSRWILSSTFKHNLYDIFSQPGALQLLCVTTCAVKKHSRKSPEFIAAADSVNQVDHEEVTDWGGLILGDITILQLQQFTLCMK